MTNSDVLSRSLRSLNRASAQLDHALAEKLGLRPLDYEAMGHIMVQGGAHLGPAELGHRLRISTGRQPNSPTGSNDWDTSVVSVRAPIAAASS